MRCTKVVMLVFVKAEIFNSINKPFMISSPNVNLYPKVLADAWMSGSAIFLT